MSTYSDHQIDRMARRAARARLGWYVHAGTYLAVTAFLALLSALGGRTWALYPALGWGVGVVLHAVLVFLATDGRGFYERLVAQERQRLLQHRDPW